MVAVGLSEQQSNEFIEQVTQDLGPGNLKVACVNSPTNVTISGDKDHVDVLASRISQASFFARVLKVPVAYHGPHMEIVAKDYLDAIGAIDPGFSSSFHHVNMVSSVTGEHVTPAELREPAYWVRNLVSQVKFAHAMERVFSEKRQVIVKKLDLSHRKIVWATDIVEIGPHATLSGPIRDCLRPISHGKDVNYFSSLYRKKDAALTFLSAVAQLHCRGYSPDIAKLNTDPAICYKSLTSVPDLPQYEFNHTKTFWHESRLSSSLRFRKFGRDPFLGSPVADWNPQDARWRHFLKLDDSAWVRDHVINGSVIYPAAGMLTMVMNAALQLFGDAEAAAFEFQDVTFHSGLDLTDDKGVEVQLQLTSQDVQSHSGFSKFDWRLRAYRGEWSEVSRGQIRVIPTSTATNEVDGSSEKEYLTKRSKDLFESISDDAVTEIDGTALYARLWDCGYHFGQSFKRIKAAKQAASGKAWAEVSILDTLGDEIPRVIHPATLDGILQIMLPGAAESGKESRLATSVPTRINRLWVARHGLRYEETHSVKVAVSMKQTGYRNSSSNVVAFDEDDSLRVVGDGIETTAITDSAEETSTLSEDDSTLSWNVVHKPDIALLYPARLAAYLTQDAPTRAASTEYLHNLNVMLYTFLLVTSSKIEKMELQDPDGHLDFYMRWMRLQLQATGDEIAEAKHILQDSIAYNELYQKVARQHPKRSGICYRVAGELFNILSGRLDPLDFIFQGTDLPEYYENLLELADFTTPLARWLELLTHKHPNTSILEVGAGTGGLTKHVMKTLIQQGSRGATARYSKYVFTDISPSFFSHGKEIFEGCPGMEFRTLDLEKDVLAQGYEAGTFDLIFASLVLHATSSLDQSLTHLKTLLKPGGKLIAVEITNPESLSAGFVFGLLPGWWLSNDAERKDRLGPCLGAEEWHRILKRNGFSGLDHVFFDKEDATHRHISLLISTKEHIQPSDTSRIPSSSTIIATTGANEFHVRSCEEVLRSFGISPQRKQFTCISGIDQGPGNLLIIFDNASHSVLHDLGDGKFERLSQTLLQASDVLWITQKQGDISYPDSGTVYGFARTLRSENASLRFTILESDISTTFEDLRMSIGRIFETIMGTASDTLESEIADKDAMPQIPRVIEDVSLNRKIRDGSKDVIRQHVKFADGNIRLTVKTPGFLDTLSFERAADRPAELGSREVEISVRAIGVNFKDCLIALGRIPEKSMGTDCSGIVERVGRDCTAKPGDRVAVLALDTYSSIVRCHEDLIVKIPNSLPFAEAAKLPTNFVTAYHALIEVGRLMEGESVLIHAGAGGTGQAAIQIAQYFGADIFVTVGSRSKKELLMETYSLAEDHIFYSRDVSFAEGIKRRTNGRGVDLILNSLAGEQLTASWTCLASYGRFLEIGKRDILLNEKLPMLEFARNVSFAAIDIAAMIRERPYLIQKSLKAVINLMAGSRIRAATPFRVFSINEVEQAFRYLQSGINAGSVAIDIAEGSTVSVRFPSFVQVRTLIVERHWYPERLSNYSIPMLPM